MKKLSLLILILFSFSSFQAFAETLRGRVVGVHDGDTLTVLKGKTQYRIRLLGIDCPEKAQSFGEKAKLFTSELAFGKDVVVEYEKPDRYGRILGEVKVGDQNLAWELLQAGLAWHYTEYSNSMQLQRFHDMARKNRTGLWRETNPIPPWKFREGKRKPKSESKLHRLLYDKK